MAELEVFPPPAEPSPSLAELKTPEDYLDFTIERVSQSLRELADKTDWFSGGGEREPRDVEEEISQIKGNLQKLFDVYKFGGELGGHRFLPHRLPAHGIRHILLQTAFKADLATTVALMEEEKRPFYSENGSLRRTFDFADWKTEVYTSALHEIGYQEEEKFGRAGPGRVWQRALIETHEERGADLAADVARAWGLTNQGVAVVQLRSHILATKMAQQEPIHFESLSELSWEQAAHVTDLLSYALAPDYVPDGIADLWREWKGFVFDEQGKPIDLAQKKYATASLTTYVSSRFQRPGKREDGSYRWGEGSANLIQILAQTDEARFEQWQQSHRRNLDEETGREALLVKMVAAGKAADSLQLEGSINPHRLAAAAGNKKYLSEEDFRQACVQPFEEMLAKQLEEGTIFEKLPTHYLREIFTSVNDEQQKEFLAELIQGVMEESAEENTRTIEIKLSPYGWQFAAGSQVEPKLDAHFFVEAFQLAKGKFLSSEEAGERGPENIQLAITLRREDGLEKNLQLVQKLAGSGVAQFDIAGDEKAKQWQSEDTIKLVRAIKSRAPRVKIAVNLGQLAADEDSSQAYAKWQEIVEKVSIDSLLYPVSLIKDRAFLQAVLETDQTVVMLPVSQALIMGYTQGQIVDFIRSFPDKRRLKLVGGNIMLDSLSMQLFRLADAGLPQEMLKDLGVKLLW